MVQNTQRCSTSIFHHYEQQIHNLYIQAWSDLLLSTPLAWSGYLHVTKSHNVNMFMYKITLRNIKIFHSIYQLNLAFISAPHCGSAVH